MLDNISKLFIPADCSEHIIVVMNSTAKILATDSAAPWRVVCDWTSNPTIRQHLLNVRSHLVGMSPLHGAHLIWIPHRILFRRLLAGLPQSLIVGLKLLWHLLSLADLLLMELPFIIDELLLLALELVQTGHIIISLNAGVHIWLLEDRAAAGDSGADHLVHWTDARWGQQGVAGRDLGGWACWHSFPRF